MDVLVDKAQLWDTEEVWLLLSYPFCQEESNKQNHALFVYFMHLVKI